MTTIEVERLGKRHGAMSLFRRLAFAWSGPGIVCVRGPNGSGKTTLLSMLGGAAAPDDGDVRVLGHSLATQRAEALRHVYYVPDGCPVYPFVTGREWLDFVQSVRRPREWAGTSLVGAFRLEPYLDTRFGAMSLGTARKFMLAAALAFPCALLVLDEPTNGLDDASLGVLRQALAARAAAGLVVMCCHDAQEQRLLRARCVELSELESA